jgi:glycosyltransferase involved in cell wall biosynthesis
MKMCVIGPTWPFRGGIAHYTTLLVEHLRERHEVRFISYLKQYPKFLYPGNTAMDPSEDSSVLRVPCDRILTPMNPLSWLQAFQMIRRDKPDVLLLQWWTPFWSPFLFFLTRLLRAFHKHPLKTIFLCHHVMAPDGGIFDWFLARRILWRGDGLIVMSEEDFALLRRALPWGKIRGTTHPPYDVFSRTPTDRASARAKLKLDPNEPVLLFFGFIRKYKGLKFLIEALALVRKRIPAKLIVTGEFWEDARPYHELIQKLGLKDAIQIHDTYIPNDEIATYFSATDCAVLPYLEATQSGVAQVAIGFDTPVITTNVGGMSETIEHERSGLIVPPADAAALAAAIERFFDEQLAQPMAAAIRQSKGHLSWQPLVKLIEELAQPAPTEEPVHAAKPVTAPRVF